MRLFCGSDPHAIGIADARGSWNMDAFRDHVENCKVCRCGVGKVMGMMAGRSSPRKAATSRENGSKPPKPGSAPRGRPPRKIIPAPE